MGVTNKNNVPQERPTGNTIQSSFDNTYNLPNNTAENQTEQNLFSVNKDTSQHIQISADPSTSTASHDSGLILLIRSFTCLAFHGMDFINTDRPEMVFVSIPLSVQESVAVLRETTELHEKRLSSLCEF
ncbi:hypothetical protein GBA52_015377 [Prunus armeniaca]|nr:hypothetical protein GBA52_015377 [Prunus armeniaca]